MVDSVAVNMYVGSPEVGNLDMGVRVYRLSGIHNTNFMSLMGQETEVLAIERRLKNQGS